MPIEQRMGRDLCLVSRRLLRIAIRHLIENLSAELTRVARFSIVFRQNYFAPPAWPKPPAACVFDPVSVSKDTTASVGHCDAAKARININHSGIFIVALWQIQF
jgi:hypothetical protein